MWIYVQSNLSQDIVEQSLIYSEIVMTIDVTVSRP